MQRRVLIVEDHRDIADLVSLHLRDIGCDTRHVSDGLTGYHEARAGGYDLIILDLMLPGLDGLEFCRRLRGERHYTPILMLTARSAELDRILGLEIGADDYLTKPFSVLELAARVKAIFRRVDQLRETPRDERVISAGDLTIDMPRRRVTISGRSIDLTSKEFDLLRHFAGHPGQVYSRSQLFDAVWQQGSESYEHTVNSHINRLRAKIEDDGGAPKYILTVWGVGYKFNDDLDA
jgi:DNA-binding response OmpR family regulator